MICFIFQTSDVLLYANRCGHMFVVHGQLPLRLLMIEERVDTPMAHSFIIYGGTRYLKSIFILFYYFTNKKYLFL